MKCVNCGKQLPKNAAKCPTCGTFIENGYTEAYQGKTKSKALAGILMLFGIGDLYLNNPGRFLKKMVIGLFTLFIGSVVMQIADAIKIFNGTISTDAKGIPLV
ncbi:MAG: zinc-ribbon domain-containing protein [Clostridia bacterium]|nr:zinc-ribbon domain-containing protein [Clostridia bacterium]